MEKKNEEPGRAAQQSEATEGPAAGLGPQGSSHCSLTANPGQAQLQSPYLPREDNGTQEPPAEHKWLKG